MKEISVAFLIFGLSWVAYRIIKAWVSGIEEMRQMTPEQLEAERKSWLNFGVEDES